MTDAIAPLTPSAQSSNAANMAPMTTQAKATMRMSGGMRVALGAILVLAIVLRAMGVKFGLPAVYNPDEVAIMSRALTFATGDFNPHNFLYPTFYFYVLAAWVGASFVVSWALGMVPSIAAFQTLFFTDPTNIYLAGRLLGVVCGVATVLLTYVLAARVAVLAGANVVVAQRAGLVAALFLAIAPTHVRDSHYVKHDVPVTLAIVAAQIAIVSLLTRERRARETPGQRGDAAHHESRPVTDARSVSLPLQLRDARPALIAGAACGVAFSTHYYAVFLALPLLLAIFSGSRGWSTSMKHALIAGIAATVVFFALSPFILVEPRTAFHDIVANRQIVVDRAVEAQRGAFASAGAYARMLWSEAIGWPVLLASIAGLALLGRARPRVALVLVAFPVAFLLFISNTVAASRYLNPVLPTIAVLAAVALVWGLGSFLQPAPATATVRRPTAFVWLIAIAAAMSLPGLVLSLRLDYFFRQADTRTVAQQIIERNVPPGTTILLQPYSVPLAQSRDSLVEALQAHLGDARRASTKFQRRLALDPYPAPAYRTLFLGEGGLDADKIYLSYRDVAGSPAFAADTTVTGPSAARDRAEGASPLSPAPRQDSGLDALRRAGVQYVVLKRYNVPDPAVVPLRQRLAREGRLVATVSPYADRADAATQSRVAPFLHNTDTPYDPALQRPGPGIEVWQIR